MAGAEGIANATPWGAVANAAAKIASVPASSQSGDIKTGNQTFGGITVGTSVPTWVWGVGLAFLAAVVLLKMRSK